jgi:tetratricopeptide (TPR) repeat protein
VRALALARETGEAELIARCLNGVTFAEKGLAKVDTLFAHGREATNLYASLGNRAMEADSLMLVADAKILNGELAEGLAQAQESLRMCEQIGNKWGQGNCLLHIAQGLADLGRYSEALDAAKRSLEVSRDAPYVPLFAKEVLGAIYRSMLNLELAYTIHTELMEEVMALHYPLDFLAMVAAELCADCVALERWDEALALARQAAAHRNYTVLPSGHRAWPEAMALVQGGELALAEQDVDWYGQTMAPFGRHQVSYLRAKGVVAQAQGQPEAAFAHWRAAAQLAWPMALADDLWQLYWLLGDKEQATEAVRPLVSAVADPQLQAMFRTTLAQRYQLEIE